MKFRRKAQPADTSAPENDVDAAAPDQTPEPPTAPRDSREVDDELDRVDLGSLRIPTLPDREVRLQVEENSGEVQAVLILGPDGALEVRAFAAPRHDSLWEDAMPQIAEETTSHGGTVAEREGRWGTELMCTRPATAPDGSAAVQPSRIVGVDGDRWMLRGTFVGRPAVEPDSAQEWDDTFAAIVVHRGTEAMMAGEALPVTLPAQVRRVD